MKIKKVYSRRLKRDVYSFDVRIGGYRYRDTGFATKKEAEDAIAALRLRAIEIKYGIAPARHKPTMVKKVVEAYVKRLVDQMTLRRGAEYAKRNMGYVDRLKRWGHFVGVDKHISTIDEDDLSDWAQAEIDRGLKKSSVRRGLNTIRAALHFASVKFPDLAGYRVPKNPKGLGSDDERTRVLEPEEIAAISERLAGPPPKTWPHPESWRDAGDFFLIALATGIRIGDILELKWDDLNKHFATLKVKMQKVGDKELLLPLTETVEFVVARRKAEGLGSTTHIFTLRDHSIRDAFRNASKEAKIPYGQQVEGGWTVHDLRRTYLTGLLQSGVDLATVRDLAGHHSITVTSRYVRSTPSSRRNAVVAAENLVRLASTLQVNRGKKGNKGRPQTANKRNKNQ